MKIISHRANQDGPKKSIENSMEAIHSCFEVGFDVEIDLWAIEGELYLGHDNPEHKIDYEWVKTNANRLWIHLKNLEGLTLFNKLKHGDKNLNYFWHEKDKYALTSQGILWAYPGVSLNETCIAVLPETFDFDKHQPVYGVCTDFPWEYKN